MNDYLALKLSGVMQAWGGHTYEDYRHTELIPTRSGILGLLAACLGIDRQDRDRQQALSAAVQMAVRIDQTAFEPQRITDFHTVMDARKVDGKVNKFPVVSRREYLCDAQYSVLLEVRADSPWHIDDLRDAVRKPVYTPFLGRRSCPPTRPLFDATVQAVDIESAFALLEPCAGTIYAEQPPATDSTRYRLRDVPLHGRRRQLATRDVFIYQQETGHVSD